MGRSWGFAAPRRQASRGIKNAFRQCINSNQIPGSKCKVKKPLPSVHYHAPGARGTVADFVKNRSKGAHPESLDTMKPQQPLAHM